MKTRSSLVLLAALIGALTGGIIAVQGQFNGDLTSSGVGPLLAGGASYLGSLISIILIIVVRGQAVQALTILRSRGQWWWFVIGLSGIPVVLAMSWGIPLVGVAITSVCSVAGQTVAGLLFDAKGIGLPAPLRLSGKRIAAALISLLGLSLAIGSSLSAGAKIVTLVIVGLVVFFGGAILCIQQAGNGAVTAASGNPLIAGFTSIVGGSIGIGLIIVGTWTFGGLAGTSFPSITEQWWLYLGGPLGAIAVVCAAWVVRHLGTFGLTLAIVAGQMLTAMVLDLFSGVGLSWQTVVAVAVVVTATVLVVSPSAAAPKEPTSLKLQ